MARDGTRLVEIVQQLARLRTVPGNVLADIVASEGACMKISTHTTGRTTEGGTDDDTAGPPLWLYEADTDRELAARLCQGCRVQRPCLELELRLFGDHTVGVWGALGEDDRRALVPLWQSTAAEIDVRADVDADAAPKGGGQ